MSFISGIVPYDYGMIHVDGLQIAVPIRASPCSWIVVEPAAARTNKYGANNDEHTRCERPCLESSIESRRTSLASHRVRIFQSPSSTHRPLQLVSNGSQTAQASPATQPALGHTGSKLRGVRIVSGSIFPSPVPRSYPVESSFHPR